MPGGIKKRIWSHQVNITERGIMYQKSLSDVKTLFKQVSEEIYNMDEKSWKWSPRRMLKITKDARKNLKNHFGELEQLYQTKNLPYPYRIPLTIAKNETLKLFTKFENRLHGWLDFEFKENGVDLTGKFMKYEREIERLQEILRNEKFIIFGELEKAQE